MQRLYLCMINIWQVYFLCVLSVVLEEFLLWVKPLLKTKIQEHSYDTWNCNPLQYCMFDNVPVFSRMKPNSRVCVLCLRGQKGWFGVAEWNLWVCLCGLTRKGIFSAQLYISHPYPKHISPCEVFSPAATCRKRKNKSHKCFMPQFSTGYNCGTKLLPFTFFFVLEKSRVYNMVQSVPVSTQFLRMFGYYFTFLVLVMRSLLL